MRDFKKLKALIALSGYKLSFLASQLGINRVSLTKKLNGETEFKASEIKKLCLILKIEEREIFVYFFAN